MFKRLIASLLCVTFIYSNLQQSQAQDFSINQLPVPGTIVGESTPFSPLALKGLVVNLHKPLEFQFIVDTGSSNVIPAKGQFGHSRLLAGIQYQEQTLSLKQQVSQLIKYFLAGLTIPEGDLWVNLSPYEKNRMVPAALGQTDLGRDLLAQDYILKQLTASLIYPEKDLGKEFWSRVYAKAQAQFGTTNVPVNTFNKVWILPDQAQVFENVNAAYVTKSTLKVMLDEDYLSLQRHGVIARSEATKQSLSTHSLASNIVRQIILPEIEKEVNTGKNFAPLRQIYQALILAKWYKETIQNGLLDAVYTNKNKIAGINLNDPAIKDQIYERYLKAYKKGTFNYIKEDLTSEGQAIPRKYFSGGTSMAMTVSTNGRLADVKDFDGAMAVLKVELEKDKAMSSWIFGGSDSNTGATMTVQEASSFITASVGRIRRALKEKRGQSSTLLFPPVITIEYKEIPILKMSVDQFSQVAVAGAFNRKNLSGDRLIRIMRYGNEFWIFDEAMAAGETGGERARNKTMKSVSFEEFRRLYDNYKVNFTTRVAIHTKNGRILSNMRIYNITKSALEYNNPLDTPDSRGWRRSEVVFASNVLSIEYNAAMTTDAQPLPSQEVSEHKQLMEGLLKQQGFNPKQIRAILSQSQKREYLTDSFQVPLKFEGIDNRFKRKFPKYTPQDFEKIETVLQQGRLETIKFKAEKMLPTFIQTGTNLYYLVRYFSEKIAHVPFAFELDEFISEAVVAGHGAISQSHETTTNFSKYIIDNINYHFARSLAKDWRLELGSVSRVRNMLFYLRPIIEDPPVPFESEFLVPDLYVIEKIEQNPEIAELVEEIQSMNQMPIIESDVITENFSTMGHEIQNAALGENLLDLLRTLTPKEEKVIKLRFGLAGEHEQTYEQIARGWGQVREAARQNEQSGFNKLRKRKSRRLLSIRGFLGRLDPSEEANMLYGARMLQLRAVRRSSNPEEKEAEETDYSRHKQLTQAQENKFLALTARQGSYPGVERRRFTALQWRILPYVLQHYSPEQISKIIKRDVTDVIRVRQEVLRSLRFIFVLGTLREFGSNDQVFQDLLRLSSENALQRLFRHTGINKLLAISKGDIEGIVEFVMQMYPGLFKEQDIRDLAKKYFEDILTRIQYSSKTRNANADEILKILHQVVDQVSIREKDERRKLVLRRLIRDRFYQVIVDNADTGLETLKAEIAQSQADPLWRELLNDTYNYYKAATAFHPRGFQENTEFGNEPLLPAQRFGIWEAVQSLQDSQFESAVHMSEARIGKTIMAILSAYNIQDKDTHAYTVKKVLYTTSNAAKYEVAHELEQRTDLGLKIFVIDSTDPKKGTREEQIQAAEKWAEENPTRNVVLIANYDAIRLSPEAITKFAPDAHIIDEVENLKGGEDTKRAPIIFGIPARYRIGISARPVINSKDDVIELLLWARHHTYLPPGKDIGEARKSLEELSADAVFEALDPIKVRWRRKVVMPQVKEPVEHIEYIEYSPLYEQAILNIQKPTHEFMAWESEHGRPEKITDKDHLFKRFQKERQASIDLGLVMRESFPGELLEQSAKVKRLDQIIADAIKENGKVVVLTDFIGAVERLKDRYNDRYGHGAAVGISSDVPVDKRLEYIAQFRKEQRPLVLIGTTATIGSSLNLFQVPGSPFHISTLVRLSRPWVNVDDGDRLVGIGQNYQVNVITLVSTFRKETLALGGPQRTIEERLQDVLAQKKVIFKNVVDGKPVIDDEARGKLEALAAGENAAMTTNGGIDLNQINVKRNGKTINVQFDPAQLTQLEQGGFQGFTPVITGFQYIKSPFPLLGVNANQPEKLAKVQSLKGTVNRLLPPLAIIGAYQAKS